MERISCTDYKLGILAIKYIPIIMFLIMWIHTGLLIFSMSNMFKFCYIHKALTMYSLAIDLCINFLRYIGFGYIVEEFRILMFIIGTILFFLLLFKFNKYRYKCCILREKY